MHVTVIAKEGFIPVSDEVINSIGRYEECLLLPNKVGGRATRKDAIGDVVSAQRAGEQFITFHIELRPGVDPVKVRGVSVTYEALIAPIELNWFKRLVNWIKPEHYATAKVAAINFLHLK